MSHFRYTLTRVVRVFVPFLQEIVGDIGAESADEIATVINANARALLIVFHRCKQSNNNRKLKVQQSAENSI